MKNINEIKVNKGVVGIHTGFLAGDLLHFYSQFEKYVKAEVKPIAEDLRWPLVPIVAIFESFYKEILAKYIDFGDPYLERASNISLERQKNLGETLIGLSKKSYSVGEIFSYSLKYGSFEDIRKNYETLCDCDYMEKIESYKFDLGLADLNEIDRGKTKLKSVFEAASKIFPLRHSLVHEYPANNVLISLEELLEYLDSAWLLLMITDRMFWADTKLQSPYSTFR
jgi:hypothetical protein